MIFCRRRQARFFAFWYPPFKPQSVWGVIMMYELIPCCLVSCILLRSSERPSMWYRWKEKTKIGSCMKGCWDSEQKLSTAFCVYDVYDKYTLISKRTMHESGTKFSCLFTISLSAVCQLLLNNLRTRFFFRTSLVQQSPIFLIVQSRGCNAHPPVRGWSAADDLYTFVSKWLKWFSAPPRLAVSFHRQLHISICVLVRYIYSDRV